MVCTRQVKYLRQFRLAEVEVELAPSVRVKALKGTLTEVRPHGVKPAND